MKLALISDLHLDAVTGGVERLPELEAFFAHVLRVIQEDRVDVLMMLGDVFDPGARREAALQAVFLRHAMILHQACALGSVWIAGNHDVIERRHDGEVSTVLSPLDNVVRHVDLRIDRCPDVAEVPRCFLFGDKMRVLALPYMARASGDDYAHHLDEAIAELESLPSLWKDLPLIVVGHLMFDGMTPGSEAEMLRGRDIPFPIEKIAALRPTFVANGHYHKRETIERGGLQIEIVGAPLHMNFGERDDGARGVLIVEV